MFEEQADGPSFLFTRKKLENDIGPRLLNLVSNVYSVLKGRLIARGLVRENKKSNPQIQSQLASLMGGLIGEAVFNEN